MPMRTIYKPGNIVPASGVYAELTAIWILTGRNVTCVQGEAFPPTQYDGYGYRLVYVSNP